jgi:hypothetical protein
MPPLGFVSLFADRGAEVGLDAIGRLEAVFEEQLDERLVSGNQRYANASVRLRTPVG